MCQQKALIVNSGRNTTLEGIELFGVSDRENVAGVRHQGTNLTMIGMHLHDNDDGILTGAHPPEPDYLLFDSCVFERKLGSASASAPMSPCMLSSWNQRKSVTTVSRL